MVMDWNLIDINCSSIQLQKSLSQDEWSYFCHGAIGYIYRSGSRELKGAKKKNLSISIKMLKCMSGNILGNDI